MEGRELWIEEMETLKSKICYKSLQLQTRFQNRFLSCWFFKLLKLLSKAAIQSPFCKILGLAKDTPIVFSSYHSIFFVFDLLYWLPYYCVMWNGAHVQCAVSNEQNFNISQGQGTPSLVAKLLTLLTLLTLATNG